MNNIYKQEKYKVLTLFCRQTTLLISGALAGITTLFTLLVLIVPIVSYTVVEVTTWQKIIFLLVSYTVAGLLASLLSRLQYKENRPYLYFLFLAFILYLFVFARGFFPFKEIRPAFFLFPFITAVILADPLRHIWSFWHNFYISRLTKIDYKLIIDKQNFQDRLELEFRQAKHYLHPLSLGLVSLKNFSQLQEEFGSGLMIKIQGQIMQTIQHHMRSSDILGRLGGGEIISVLSRTTETELIAGLERVKNLLRESPLKIEGKTIKVEPVFGAAGISEKTKDKENLIEASLLSLAQAREDYQTNLS